MQANPLNQIMGMLKASNNPVPMIHQMAATDPRMQEVANVINQNGGVQQAVYALAKQKGVDPNYALQQAQQQLQSMNR